MINLIKTVCTSLLILFGYHSVAQNCFEKCKEDMVNSNLSPVKRGSYIVSHLVGCKAPDFKVRSLEGDTLELSKLRGKVVVLNFWFTSCAPCLAELPGLNDLVDKFKNREVVFIAFEKKNNERVGDYGPLNEFLTAHEFKYQIVQSDIGFAMKYCTLSG